MKATITEQHAWLQALVGEWRSEMPCPDGNGTLDGTERVRLLGEAWLLLEGRGTMPDGTPTHTLMTLGYDPAQQAFVGSWIGSMMNHLWLYRGGTLDDARRLLALPSDGPAFDGSGRLVPYRDEIEVVSRDERQLHGHTQQPDGSWLRFCTTRYTRIG